MPARTRSATVALTIAGSDSGANAGIQADLLTFAALGVYGTTAITSITAQNPDGVAAASGQDPDLVAAQIRQVVDYYAPRAIKTGMLLDARIVTAVACELRSLGGSTPIVVDPVMIASSGDPLIDDDAVSAIKAEILPLATLITPNLDEASRILEQAISTLSEMTEAARTLSKRYSATVLIKGGHLEGTELTDIVCTTTGEIRRYHQDRIDSIDTHGSGCTLSAAIAAELALGSSSETAIEKAREYLRHAMERPIYIREKAFINHFPGL